MKKSSRTKSSNNQIIKFLMVFGLSALLLSGCQPANNSVNSNATANAKTEVAKANTNTEAAKTNTNTEAVKAK